VEERGGDDTAINVFGGSQKLGANDLCRGGIDRRGDRNIVVTGPKQKRREETR